MDQEILKDLSECQSLIYKEYSSSNSDLLDVLNEFCAEFLKCCNKLHKILIFDCQGKYEFVEFIFVCLHQVICCIKYLEKTIEIEKASNSFLHTTRQYFFDRILWCIARIKSLLNSIKDDVFFTTTLEEANFVDVLDAALEYLAPYSSYDHEKIMNKSAFKTEIKFDCQKLRASIDKVIGQALAFANVSQSNDKKIINVLCQKILRDCISFENECSLSEKDQLGNQNDIHLQAVIVENALYKLEDFINESLLRLIFLVFTDLNHSSVDNINKLIQNKPTDENNIDDMIADFDINVDRLIQIGVFAVAFAPNSQVKTIVRNCLASLESLDSNLIPSIYAKCNLHFTILEEHFMEEIEKLKKCLQKIIETGAFTESFLNILTENINNEPINIKILEHTIEMANLLIEHFELNEAELKLNEEEHDKFEKYKNFKVMVKECQAVLTCANQIDSERIIKRFKIMRYCLKKLRISLNVGCNNGEKEKENDVFITSEELLESKKMFESFGISPTIRNILYQSKRNRKDLTGSLIAQCSKVTNFNCDTDEFRNSPERRTIKRRVSLRTALFKRLRNEETERLHQFYVENTMNLGITDILDQLTNLSSSFGNLTVSD